MFSSVEILLDSRGTTFEASKCAPIDIRFIKRLRVAPEFQAWQAFQNVGTFPNRYSFAE